MLYIDCFNLQILEEICQKSNWGQPIFTLHSTASTSPDEETLYLYKVMVPGLSMTYIPAKLTRSTEEAKIIAADYSLVQLGFPMEGTSLVYVYIIGRIVCDVGVQMCMCVECVLIESAPTGA